jgi:predicted nucleotidyltransferase
VCSKSGLKILPENPEDFARETKVLPAEESKLKIRVDFIFSFTPYEAQAIKRTKEIVMNDYPVKFASCEDVVIHKMVAARAVDVEDARSIIIKNNKTIDLEYIRRWLSDFGRLSEHEGILDKFESLLQ